MNEIRAFLQKRSEYRAIYLLKGFEFHSIVKQIQQIPKNDGLQFNQIESRSCDREKKGNNSKIQG